MSLFDKLFGKLNIISILFGNLTATANGRYKSMYKKEGWAGVIKEVFVNLTGWNTFTFSFPRDSSHTLESTHSLLKRYGVFTFGYLHDDKNFYFKVRKTQAKWAEHCLVKAGVELNGKQFYPNNFKGSGKPMPVSWESKNSSEKASDIIQGLAKEIF